MPTVLVAIDFSDITERIVQVAAEWAQVRESGLLILHVAPPDPDFVTYRVGPQEERDDVAHMLHDLRDGVRAIADRLSGGGLQTEGLVVQGNPAEKVLEEAAKRKVSMIVMGSHGHGRLHNMLVGSATEGVVRKARCPVLIVPANT